MTRPDADYRAWLDRLAAERRGDRLGTAAHIDAAARRRAAEATRSGTPVPLARPLQQPGYQVDVSYTDGPIGMGSDRLELDCHGRANTHLDALNHIALDATWHGGFAVDDPAAPSVVELAEHGLVTRGVVIDVPAVRGTEWADADEPVGSADIEASLERTGTTVEPGDALLLYMGRDRYEDAGNAMSGLREGSVVPGVGRSGAEWIADHRISILCWDFLDSNHPSEPFVPVHLLIWALGLVLVDNCHLAGAAAAVASRAEGPCGTLVVAPIAVPGATGCVVRPLLLL